MLKQMLYDPASGFTASMADAQIGIYSACYKLAMLVTILLQAYRYAAEPFFFNQLQNQDRNKLYVKLMNYFVAVVCLVFLVVSLNLDVFKFFIASESYWEGLKVVPILLLANVFLGIYINQSIWYKLSNQTKYGAYISLLGAALTLLINYLFIPIYGYVASAWATMLVYAFQMLVSYFWGQKHYPIPYNLRKFALYLGLSVGIFLLSANLFDATFSWLKFGVNNLMIVFYLFIVSAVEGIKLKKINL
jgi:O-antigen/teichoic acid export membrane protein